MLRRDAEENRLRLLQAAREVFGEQGVEAPLETVAHRAGVGIATLYRRFPDRARLLDALLEERSREYLRLSELALERDDAGEALRSLVEEICEMQAADRAFRNLMQASCPRNSVAEPHITAAERNTEALIVRAKKEGALREDFAFEDLAWLLIANGAFLELVHDTEPEAWRRPLALFLDALRVEGRSAPLPPPVDRRMLRGGC